MRIKSELAELWAEDDDTEWQMALDNLLLRLDRTRPYKAPQKKKLEKFPDDFLGHCYMCLEPVTERDGLLFEQTEEGAGTIGTVLHRACIEVRIDGPHWNKDGSPTKTTQTLLLRDMGFDV